MNKKLIICDGHNLLWKSFSVPFKFYSSKGIPLHVVTTFLKQIRRSIEAVGGLTHDDHLVVVFDTETSNSNFELLKDYKANRKQFLENEDSPYKHLQYIKHTLSKLNITFLEVPNYEADDIIASITYKFINQSVNNTTYIVSSDSDFYQLINSSTFIVRLQPQNKYEIIDSNYLKNKFKIYPENYVLYKSLVGDKADNIKGIRGIGPVLASKIINNEIPFNIESYKEVLDINIKLIKLNKEIDLDIEYNPYRFEISKLSNSEIFKICEF